jgi:hypothetical protein
VLEEEPMRILLGSLVALLAYGCGGGNTGTSDPQDTAPGADQSTKTTTLETGANLLQFKGPVEKISMYLDGFHAAKANPAMQMEAHHYCNQVNEDFAQCVLYDGNTDDARMMGIEYIISEQSYNKLPSDEKAYWHPHNYEILSGQLRMPGLPDVAEKEALKGKMNSYGKTWHTWMTGMHGGKNDSLPLGPPHLQWSFNRDGEDAPGLVEGRDKRMDLNTADERKDRADLVPLARPQGGVDAMAGMFPNAKPPMAGVSDNGDAATKPVPTFGMKGAEGPTTGR